MSTAPHVPVVVSDRLREKIRLLRPVGLEGECWPWIGRLSSNGYGMVSIGKGGDRSNLLTHRLIWVAERGPIPPGMLVLHQCDNPPCCNPSHLFLGTYQDNCDDMIAKGRAPLPPMIGRRGTAHPRSLYDDATRAEAVRLYREGRWTKRAIAKHLGCHRVSVARWIGES